MTASPQPAGGLRCAGSHEHAAQRRAARRFGIVGGGATGARRFAFRNGTRVLTKIQKSASKRRNGALAAVLGFASADRNQQQGEVAEMVGQFPEKRSWTSWRPIDHSATRRRRRGAGGDVAGRAPFWCFPEPWFR
jgi:hypothetical protein